MGTTGSSISSAFSYLHSSSTSTKEEMEEEGYIRRAHHAGSWYTSSPTELNAQLSSFLADAELSSSSSSSSHKNGVTLEKDVVKAADSEKGGVVGVPRAIIAPHAGYSYSGPTAAHAYLALKEALQVVEEEHRIDTIVVLHPSHHVRLDKCAVSGASIIETPILNLQISSSLRTTLLSSSSSKKNVFTTMTQPIDEHEHSGEMHYPFIAKCILDSNIPSSHHPQVLPIMVGGLSTTQEEFYGTNTLLQTTLKQKNVFTIVSTDFCHWGKRFGYTPTSTTKTEQIYQYITQLDQMGMNMIEAQKPGAFAEYLREYHNTICGRHPIAVWLHAIVKRDQVNGVKGGEEKEEEEELEVEFVKYAQSSQVVSMRESSVSYASAVARRCGRK